ncbi:major capsid protein [Comamonas sp. C24C]
MATLGLNGKVTLLDIAQATDPKGNIAAVAELLTQTNEILLDMPWMEGNLPTGHKAAIRTGLPTPIWRSFYQGVPPTKSQRAQIIDACGMLEDRSEVDADEANLNGNSAAFRLSEARAHVEGMNQTMASTLFYGNASLNPERFNGLAPRYNTVNTANSQLANNVIDAGGTGSNNTSIWLVVWGSDTVTGIYPKGMQAGLTHEDLGVIDAFDDNQRRFRAYADLWKWKCGLHVKDWRYVVRIANINVANLVSETGAADLVKLMIRAGARIPHRGMGKAVFYANRTVKEMLAIQALNKSQNALNIKEAVKQFGDVGIEVQELNFLGTPVRTCDQILTTEARVV